MRKTFLPLQVQTQIEDEMGERSEATGASTTHTKRVDIQPNPNFFNDIFNVKSH